MFKANDRLSVLTENEKRELMLSLEELAQIEGLRGYSASDSENSTYSELRIVIDSKAEKNDVIRHDGSVALTNDWDVGDGLKIKIDEIRARDGDGLKLGDDDGNGIFVDDGGLVGIGNSNPVGMLDVSANASPYAQIFCRDTRSGGEVFRISVGTTGGGLAITETATSGFSFGTIPISDLNASMTILATLLPSGNFGIGTTSPSARLDVNGDAKISGNIGLFGGLPVGQRLKANYNNWASLSDVVQALVDIGIFDQV